MVRSSFDLLFDASSGAPLPLPPVLKSVYGDTRFPSPGKSRHVFANFVSTLDGVVSLGLSDPHRGGEISGFSDSDQMVMGLLRAVADFVVIGAGAVRALPDHLWTPECIYPDFGAAYQELRRALGKPAAPTTVIVSQQADVPLDARVFREPGSPFLILTTAAGAQRLERGSIASARIATLKPDGSLTPMQILSALEHHTKPWILFEAGPAMLADFLAARCLDELFLTVSPQIAGRDNSPIRPGFAQGRIFAPDNPVWGELVSVRRAKHHLFLRYAFSS